MRKVEVAAFKDAFAIFAYYPAQMEDGFFYGRAEEELKEVSHGFRFSRNGETIVPEKHHDIFLFEGSINGVEVEYVDTEDVVNTYTSDVEGLSDVDKETYDKLSANFQSKYKKVASGKKEVSHEVTLNVKEHDVDFDLNRYMGTYVSEIEKIVKGEDYTKSPSLSNVKPFKPAGETILDVLVSLYDREREDLNSLIVETRKSFIGLGRRSSDEYESMTVKYFSKPYNGEKKKHYHRKVNGGMYADRRHRLVPDYPDVVSVVRVTSDELRGMPLGDNEDDALESIKALYQAVFHP